MMEHASADRLSPDEARAILTLRLLIARAANADSLAWWDDESLTPHARFLLERVFPMAPPMAARSLALAAALARHQAVCRVNSRALHLYRLDADGLDRLTLRFAPLLPVPVPEEPIHTMDALRQHLLRLTGEPSAYTVLRQTDRRVLQIRVPSVPDRASPLLQRARTLAWAYLEGRPGEPVFPITLE